MASSSLATPLPQALRLEITPLRLGGGKFPIRYIDLQHDNWVNPV
jgi:hypothetical protein